MANEHLESAIGEAGLTLEAFAQVIQVDPKSVHRWVSGGTTPYPKHRKAITSALNLTEQDLWPGLAADPGNDAETNAGTTGTSVTTGGAGQGDDATNGCDVLGTWAHADEDSAPDLVAFITGTAGPVDVLDSCCGVEITPTVTGTLAEAAAAGRPVRVLTDGRAPCWEPLLGRDDINLFLCEIPGEYWMIKTGDRMLVTINLEREPGTGPSPPLLELAAIQAGRLFDRLTGKFEELWELAHDTPGNRPQRPPARPDTPASGQAASGQRPAAGVRRWPRQPS